MKTKNEFVSYLVGLDGQNVVEASAGTGKTFSITGLFLRLLTERQMPVEKILTVTFTKAATAELKTKIRTRISEAIEYISNGGNDNTEFECIKKYDPDCRLLRHALLNFDDAPIYTIHSFCGRMLKENAFESGVRFDSEIVESDAEIIDMIAMDFWRKNISYRNKTFVKYLVSKNIKLENFKKIVKNKINHPGLITLPQDFKREPDYYLDELNAKMKEIKNMWTTEREHIISLLNTGVLNKTYYSSEALLKLFEMMDNMDAENIDPYLLTDKEIGRFDQEFITKKTNKGKTEPEHKFFELCGELIKSDFLHKAYVSLSRKLADDTEELRISLSEKMRRRTSGDLIADLSRALNSPAGSKLKSVIRSKFDAALIDEFQDTDPLQWDIFRNLFLEGGKLLFLIGDPKQSIYKFRGAEVNSYFRAAESVGSERIHTLKNNFRSEKKLIEAVNCIFESPNSFHTEKIEFAPVDYPGDKKKELRLEFTDEEEKAPFRMWFIEKTGDKTVPKNEVDHKVEYAVSGEIVRLLNLYKDQKLKLKEYDSSSDCEKEIEFNAGKIAVLVRTNAEGRSMCETLRKRNVPAVMLDNSSVYGSDEAVVIERILSAVSEPKNLSLLKAALATGLVKNTGNSDSDKFTVSDIDALAEDDIALAEVVNRFCEMYKEWNKRGFFAMFRKFLSENNSLEEILKFRDGERRVTNILHIAELLGKEAAVSALSPEKLIKYLRARMLSGNGAADESELRMESDDKAVKVVTSHKSKGLEYPVVFCPYLYESAFSTNKNRIPLFHNENGDVVMDLSNGDRTASIRKYEEEELEDSIRLMYVSLTRAKCRCYTVWGQINGAEKSPMFYVLHGKSEKNTELNDMRSQLEAKIGDRQDRIALLDIPDFGNSIYVPDKEEKQLIVKSSSRTFEHSDILNSFSGISSGHLKTNSSADRDENAGYEIPVMEDSGPTVFNMPGGTSTGNCLHKIFESIDFQAPCERNIILPIMKNYGVKEKYLPCIETILNNVLNTNILPEENFSLSMLSKSERIHETEFYYPVQPDVKKKILNALDYLKSEEDINENSVSLRGGYMNGQIDMIFKHNGKYYIVDWKSNNLGSKESDYLKENLKDAMRQKNYDIQLAIYALALKSYLSSSKQDYNYDKDFGGVIYIFLRGVSMFDDPGCGIYFEKPGEEEIKNLESKILRKPNGK